MLPAALIGVPKQYMEGQIPGTKQKDVDAQEIRTLAHEWI
jgi:hypothetical protein